MILFFGDNHGEFDYILETTRQLRPEAIVLLGDLEPPVHFHELMDELQTLCTVRFVHGNHDADSEEAFDRVFAPRLAHLNLHGRVETLAGVRIAGLGGVFRGKVWFPKAGDEAPQFHSPEDFLARTGKGNRWRGGLPMRHHGTIFPSVVERLARQRADILVSHEAPDCHPNGFGALTRLAQQMQCRSLFHGHHHTRIEYGDTRATLRFQAWNVGFREMRDDQGRLLLAEPAKDIPSASSVTDANSYGGTHA